MGGDGVMAKAWLALVAAVTGMALVPAVAAADSIVFIKDGNVWIAAPDGSKASQLTTDGGYESPSESDNGTIMAGGKRGGGGRNGGGGYRVGQGGKLADRAAEDLA